MNNGVTRIRRYFQSQTTDLIIAFSIDNHGTHDSSKLSRKHQLFHSGQQTQASGLHASNDSLRREIRAVIHDLYQLEELERSERCGRGEVKNTTGAENVV